MNWETCIASTLAVLAVAGCLAADRALAGSPAPYQPTMDAAMAMTTAEPPPKPIDMNTPMTTPMMKDGMMKAELMHGAMEKQKHMQELLDKEQSTMGGESISSSP